MGGRLTYTIIKIYGEEENDCFTILNCLRFDTDNELLFSMMLLAYIMELHLYVIIIQGGKLIILFGIRRLILFSVIILLLVLIKYSCRLLVEYFNRYLLFGQGKFYENNPIGSRDTFGGSSFSIELAIFIL